MFRKLYSDKFGIPVDDRDLIYVCCYRSQGCIAILQNWVINGLTEPCDHIIWLLSSLDSNAELYFSGKKMK